MTESKTILPFVLIGALIFAGTVGAASFTVDTASGDGEVEPDDNSQVQEGFNPDILCADHATIDELLLCLLDQIITLPTPCVNIQIQGQSEGSNGGEQIVDLMADTPDEDCPVNPDDRGDFIVRFLPDMPPYGLEILTTEYEEIEKITLEENDTSIQWTELRLGKSHRRIRIGDIVEQPSGRGEIYITLNHREMRIPTHRTPTSVELTAAIIGTLRDNGFDVSYEYPYTWVTYDRRSDRHIGQVSFRSTDPSVVTSDIGILPPDPAVPESEIHPIDVSEPGLTTDLLDSPER